MNGTTTDALATAAGCSVDTVRRACQRGEIPGARKFGRVWLIPDDAAETWRSGYEPYGTLRGPRPTTPEEDRA